MKKKLIETNETLIIEIMVNGIFYTATVITSFSKVGNFEREFNSIEIENEENLSDELIELIKAAIENEF